MRETLDQYLIQQYELTLKAELAIQGLSTQQQTESLAEAMDHLTEAMEAAKPATAEEVKRVISQFGSAKLLAKRLASEQARSTTRRRFLWPALSIPPMMYLALHPLPQSRLFHDSIYSGTLYLILRAIILFVLGIKARKPLFGQFLAVTTVLIICPLLWYPVMDYPMVLDSNVNSQSVEPVPRQDYDKELASLGNAIATENKIATDVKMGKALFAGQTAPANLPASYLNDGKYWLPEGLREVEIGIKPNEIYAGLLASSWSAAVAGWNTPNNHGYVQESDADRLLRQSPEQIKILQGAIGSLQYFRNQPPLVQMEAYVPSVALRAIALCTMAALITNAGWLAWLLWLALGRAKRRVFLSLAT